MRGASSSKGGRSVADRADDLAIRDGERRIRLKWHKLRRHADDPAFDRGNLVAGLAAGASMEVDIRLLADDRIACLHDAALETQTDGIGPVDRADSETIRSLRQTDESGVATTLWSGGMPPDQSQNRADN